MNGSDDVVPGSDEGEDANITETAILMPTLRIKNIAEAPTSAVSILDAVMDSDSDGQQGSDFDPTSMSPVRMTPIYERVIELKQRAAAPASSVTEPETDVPLQLMHISKVRIYIYIYNVLHRSMSLMMVPFSGTNATQLQVRIVVFVSRPRKTYARTHTHSSAIPPLALAAQTILPSHVSAAGH
jgi:hypothetical protein